MMQNNKFKTGSAFRLGNFILAAALIPLLLTGCVEKELINDPTTGAIMPTKNLETLIDGQYTATTSYYDGRGYAQQLNIFIKNGLITKVNFQEIDRSKTDRLAVDGPDKTWPNLVVTNLSSLYLRLYNELISSQNPDEIDAISGATQTSERYVKLAKKIFAQAKKGDQEPIKIDTLDTYTIITPPDHDGYQGVLEATFNGSTLTALNYDEIITEDGKSKRKSTDSPENADFNALFDTITQTAVNNQSLESAFPANDAIHEKAKYEECLRLLREARSPF